jgi:hypothetical protein
MIAPTTLRGVITGKIIELERESGFPSGQEILVTIEQAKFTVDKEGEFTPGEGLRRAFGAWAEDAEDLDKYLEWNRQQRKIRRTPLE